MSTGCLPSVHQMSIFKRKYLCYIYNAQRNAERTNEPDTNRCAFSFAKVNMEHVKRQLKIRNGCESGAFFVPFIRERKETSESFHKKYERKQENEF